MDSNIALNQSKQSTKQKLANNYMTYQPFTIRDLESQERALNYTSATGSYTCWSTEVNLGPPDSSKSVPLQDEHVRQYYEALQYTLYETGYPETVDRTDSPRGGYTDLNPAIVILSSPVECMCLVLEGGKQCPGDMILVLSTTWLSKSPSTDPLGEGELFTLHVHKGITGDKAGNTYIDVFDPPRRVTYFVDFFTNACTGCQRSDGEEIEINLECPMSSSVELSKVVDNKLLTRILLAKHGVKHPKTLAFPYNSNIEYQTDIDSVTICPITSTGSEINIVSAAIITFLTSEEMAPYKKVVVKPSGSMWYGSQLVSLHTKTNPESILAAAAEVLPRLMEGDALLVESFCEPAARTQSMGQGSVKQTGLTKSPQLGFRIRANVCRDPEDEAVMSSITCGVGNASEPINGDNTVVQSLAATLHTWGISDPEECQRIRYNIAHKSEATMNSIIEYEETLPLSMKGTVGAQTDIIGIDFILTRENGLLDCIPIEVNSHDCTINNQIYEFMNPASSGEAVRPLVNTMLFRSMKYIMKGKKVLVIGAGGFSKSFVWEAAEKYGILVYLVDCDRKHFATDMVKDFIEIDISDHTLDIQHSWTIAEEVQGRKLDVDGCVTFWEDCVPLAAMVCEKLELDGAGLRGSIIAKTKSLTQKIISSRTADIPHWPRTHLYSSKTVRIESHTDIENAAQIMKFPAMMKLEYGSSAIGVTLVENIDQCHDFLDQIQKDLQTEADHPGIGLGHGNAMLLMDYVEGTEHDVDVIIYRRKLIGAFVSDNGPTHIPNFTETASAMPTFLSPCKKKQLIVAAYQCCTEIGLENGTFNVEMKMTPKGPKLIEINARMGGFYLRDWIKQCYKVDILLCSFAVACGVKPLFVNSEPSCQLVGIMLTPNEHSQSLTPENVALLKKMSNKGILRLNQFEETADCQTYVEPFCNIAVMAKIGEEAKSKLIQICKILDMNSKEYSIDYWFKDFESA